MRLSGSALILAATDLSSFFECERKTVLELAVIGGSLERPGQNELERKLLEQRGIAHERRVLDAYRGQGLRVAMLSPRPRSSIADLELAARDTEAAMTEGADVISQGVLFDGSWLGRPDFLVRRQGRSRFGTYFYEVVDAKLARHARAAAILQLCTYTDQLARIQDFEPDHFAIVPGNEDLTPLRLRAADFMAFYRMARRSLEACARTNAPQEPYPEPVEHCEVCLWWKQCEQRRRQDDHLSLVAGITRRQRDRLALAGVKRVAELGALSATASVNGISDDTLDRIREQAALQVQGRTGGEPVYRLMLEFDSGQGLESLPRPTPGDLFLDLEGDPLVRGEGLEYLFGILELGEPSDDFFGRTSPGAPRYRAFWATNPREEKRAFESVVDYFSLKRHPMAKRA